MKRIGVAAMLLGVWGANCIPPGVSQAIQEYESSATVSPNFNPAATNRVAVLPPDYVCASTTYANRLEVYYELAPESDERPNEVYIDGKEAGSMDWVEDRFATVNLAPGSHSIKIMDFMGDALAEGRFYIGRGEKLVLRAEKGLISVDSRARMEASGPPRDMGNYLLDALNREAMRAGFSVVERAEVEKILNEQELGSSGVVDPSTAARLGRLMGADLVLISQASDTLDTEYGSWQVVVSGRLVSVETGEIVYMCRARGGGLERDYAVDQAAGNFFKRIRELRK